MEEKLDHDLMDKMAMTDDCHKDDRTDDEQKLRDEIGRYKTCNQCACYPCQCDSND